jgi:hypothetical protein
VKRCVDAGIRADQAAPGRKLTLAYERLVAEPEDETRRICDHIGIEWDALMLRPGDKPHLGDKPLTAKSDQLWYNAQSYRRNITSRPVDKWRWELTLLQQVYATMVFAAHDSVAALGYNFSMSALGRDRSPFHKILIYSGCGGIAALQGARRMVRKVRS